MSQRAATSHRPPHRAAVALGALCALLLSALAPAAPGAAAGSHEDARPLIGVAGSGDSILDAPRRAPAPPRETVNRPPWGRALRAPMGAARVASHAAATAWRTPPAPFTRRTGGSERDARSPNDDPAPD